MARSLFEQHLSTVVERYPNFSIIGQPGNQYLKGILDIPDGTSGIAASYLVEIKKSPGYPRRFPYAFEVGGDIPIGADTHKGINNQLCLTVEPDEILQCSDGLHIVDFIDTILIPHLAHQYYYKMTGSYIQAYGHSSAGVKEFYTELFGTTNMEVWKKIVKLVFSGKIGRNDLCPCGSGKKYKYCHKPSCEKRKKIGKEQVIKNFKGLNLL